MKQKLLILNLEDNLHDAELNREMLVREGIDCELICIDTREGFLDIIKRQSLDIILADYSIPSFDGPCALDLAREHCPDVPFIFVSATSGEDVAIRSPQERRCRLRSQKQAFPSCTGSAQGTQG